MTKTISTPATMTKEKKRISQADIETMLELFYEQTKHLSPRTRQQHLSNLEFYLCFYMYNYRNRTNPLNIKNVIKTIDDYLGGYYIRKNLLSTPEMVKASATSIKKFYKCMLDHGKTAESDYALLCKKLKNGLPIWMTRCARFNLTGQL